MKQSISNEQQQIKTETKQPQTAGHDYLQLCPILISPTYLYVYNSLKRI